MLFDVALARFVSTPWLLVTMAIRCLAHSKCSMQWQVAASFYRW